MYGINHNTIRRDENPQLVAMLEFDTSIKAVSGTDSFQRGNEVTTCVLLPDEDGVEPIEACTTAALSAALELAPSGAAQITIASGMGGAGMGSTATVIVNDGSSVTVRVKHSPVFHDPEGYSGYSLDARLTRPGTTTTNGAE